MTDANVSVTAQTATVRAEVPSVRILMRTHLWLSWTRIAIDHEAMAKAAREELEQAVPGDRNGFMLQREADAALVAICATAFAVEAFSRQLDELVTVPPATLEAWQRNRTPAEGRVLELLKLAVDARASSSGGRGSWHGCSRSEAAPSITGGRLSRSRRIRSGSTCRWPR
jgi:hypothetical protein